MKTSSVPTGRAGGRRKATVTGASTGTRKTSITLAEVKKMKAKAKTKSTTARGVDLWHSANPQQFVKAFKAPGPELVRLVKEGAPATFVGLLADNMQQPRTQLISQLGLPGSTLRRKAANSARLSREETSRLVGMARIIGQVQAMVDESGGPEDFDAGPWVARWMESPIPALGGSKPSEYMDTAEGQAVVSQLLSQMQSGAYA